MTALEVGKQLVELYNQGRTQQVLETLYSQDICSVEAAAMPGGSQVKQGLKAVLEATKRWEEAHQIHTTSAEGPWPHGDRFIVRFALDVTNKPSGKRFNMVETGLYTVQNGKIVREEFFYTAG